MFQIIVDAHERPQCYIHRVSRTACPTLGLQGSCSR